MLEEVCHDQACRSNDRYRRPARSIPAKPAAKRPPREHRHVWRRDRGPPDPRLPKTTTRPECLHVARHQSPSRDSTFKHSRPYHPQTCGKIERFHQTQKMLLAKQEPADTIERDLGRMPTPRRHTTNEIRALVRQLKDIV